MKKILITALGLSLTTQAYGLTSKEKSVWATLGGCGGGAAVGGYLDSQDKTANKSSTGTIAMSGLVGCVTGAAFSYFVMDDDQSAADKRADHAEHQLEEFRRSVRTNEYRPSGTAKMLDYLKLEENFTGPAALEKIVDPACEKWSFSLAFDGRSFQDAYLPVSRDIIIKNVEFLIVAPKAGSSPETICVKPNYPFGYLNLELPGLDTMLYKHGEAAAKQQKGN